MKANELDRFWTTEFGDNSPFADELKLKFVDRWFRIHTLPESKRYADNDVETNEILSRHNLILDDLFDAKDNFILVTCNFSAEKVPVKSPKPEGIGFQANFWRSINISDDEESEEYYCHLFLDPKQWKVGILDELLRLIANDEISNLMVISIENNVVYHPYDGGADVILKDSQTRDNYKQKYEHWLSARPDGF